ncbi:MAG: hypothetical protein SFW36_22250 [Leptolyngbyaceae cyanobacterium bins.59]|nr:hypothetical protein [Leptolyngbyaceae cyanobacterium bins.59]
MTRSAREIVDRALTTRQISRQQHLALASLMLAGNTLDEHDRHQINRVFEAVLGGRLQLVD